MPTEKVVIDYTFKTNLIEGLIYTFKSARIRIKHVQKYQIIFHYLNVDIIQCCDGAIMHPYLISPTPTTFHTLSSSDRT